MSAALVDQTQSVQVPARLAPLVRDFRKFCGLLQIVDFETKEVHPFRLSPLQDSFCRARTGWDFVLKFRKAYVSTLELAYDLWWFLTVEGAKVLVVCQAERDHGTKREFDRIIRIFIKSLRALGFVIPLDVEAEGRWTLNSRAATMQIIEAGASYATAQKTGRGGAVNRLHLSEVASFRYGTETFAALVGSMPAKGRTSCVVESTANGAAGYFFEQWNLALKGRTRFTPHFFPWFNHAGNREELLPGETLEPEGALEDVERTLLAKGVSRQQIKWLRAKLKTHGGNPNIIKQEFPSDPDSCFLVTGRGFFDAARVAALLAECRDPAVSQDISGPTYVEQWDAGYRVPAIRVWHPPAAGRQYVIGADVSLGVGLDAAAGVVLERGSGRHMATLWGQYKPWDLARYAVAVAKKYNGAMIAVERNGPGLTTIRALDAELHYPNVFVDHDEQRGFITTAASRTPILDTLSEAVRMGHFKTHDRYLASEMRTFAVNEKGKAEALAGCHDDLVMAAAIGYDVVCRTMTKKQSLTGIVA